MAGGGAVARCTWRWRCMAPMQRRGRPGATLRLWATALPAVAMLVAYTALRMQAQSTAAVLYPHAA